MVVRTQHLPYNVNNNMSATATNLTNTTTKTTTGLSHYFMKKKRKLFLFKFFDTFNCAKETDRLKLMYETSQQPNMPTVATPTTTQTMATMGVSAENEKLPENYMQVCLICRRHIVDSCIECGPVIKSSKCMSNISSMSSTTASHRSHNTNTNDIPIGEEMMYVNTNSHLNNKTAEFGSSKERATTTQFDLYHQQQHQQQQQLQQQQQQEQHHCQSHPHHHCHCNKKSNKLATVFCDNCRYKNKRQYSSCPTTTTKTTLNCSCKHFCNCLSIANANETTSSIAVTTNLNVTNKEMIPLTTVISMKSSTTSTSPTSPSSSSLTAANATTNAIPLAIDHPMNASLFGITTESINGTNIKSNNNNNNNNNNSNNSSSNNETVNSPRSERKPSLVYRFFLITLQYMQIYMRTHVIFSFNKRQQSPPLSRLIFLYNSYSNNNDYNNYNCNSNNYHLNKNAENANNKMAIATNKKILKTSQRKHTQKQRQQQHPQHTHHSGHQYLRSLSDLFKQQPYLGFIDQVTRSHMYEYLIIIMVVLLSVIVPTTQAQTSHQSSTATGTASATATAAAAAFSTTSQVTLSRNETVCKSLDLRNSPIEFRQLENCTVIEGFLLMTLVLPKSQEEFTETYPLLTEVTEFIIVYRIHNLRSLSQIFPNLSIIRGRELFDGAYALVVYSNPHLEDLGLSKLTTISRGGVRIENNVRLCFVETIDWSLILTNSTEIIIKNNHAKDECPQCPGDIRSNQDSGSRDLVCREHNGRRHCWNNKSCQKICPAECPNNCRDEKTCCNKACLGGCSPTNLNVCLACRDYSIYNNTCTDRCPKNYYSYLDRRCLTAQSCSHIGTKFENNKQETLVPYNGTCTTRCPDRYVKVNGTCKVCGDKCVKKCGGGLIDSVARAKEMHGCTHITSEGLTISIKRGGRYLMEDLEFGLSSIEEIDYYLKVQGTFGMFSLKFFKNLKRIKGTKLLEDKFALYVLENSDLETIWGPNQTVHIDNGRVFFHFNPKLCYDEIDRLRPMLKNNATFDKNEVATDSNGSKGSCNTTFLNATVFKVASTWFGINIQPIEFDDERTFIGYQYYFIEDKYKNVTKYGHRVCDDGWTVSEATKELRYIFSELKPFTQYAFYVKTMTISSERRNAQSPIQHIITKSAQPTPVRKITAIPKSSNEIILKWRAPARAHGKLTKYIIRAKLDKARINLGSRNYCKDPYIYRGKEDEVKPEGIVYPQTVTENPLGLLPSDCKCDAKGETIEISEETIHEGIEFENTIQNFVYVKQSNSTSSKSENSGSNSVQRTRRSEDSYLMRHMQPVADDFNVFGISTFVPPLDSATIYDSPHNETRMDPTGTYYEVIVQEVNDSTTEYTFTNLKHFFVYELGVQACREPEQGADEKDCSIMLHTDVRTLRLDNVDKVENLEAKLEPTNTTRYNIRLRWDPPTEPNGAIVSYTIIYRLDALDAVDEKKCITELDYRNMTNGYLLTGLSTGNYSIKVRANSLAGEGVDSPAKFVSVPSTQWSTTAITVTCVFAVLTLFALLTATHYGCKRLRTKPSDLKIYPNVNPYYISLQYIPDEWEVERDLVLQLSPLGQGSFGMVYEGVLKAKDENSVDTPCAIKTVNENATDRERMNFLNEASVMKKFDTFHVVRLLGVCSRGQPALVIMELMKNGDLKSYLRAHRPESGDDGSKGEGEARIRSRLASGPVQPPPLSRLYQMAIEIADGMAYLAGKKFVHRDLAARNCMVAAGLTVKIGDFGMTRDIYETDYYRKGTKGLLPVRWMAPESLRDGMYSSASDVFSYGVVLWEMATLASQPYQGLSNDQVLRHVIDGVVMERPENCPDLLYDLMQKCWRYRDTARPSFMDIIKDLLDLADPTFRDLSFYHSEEGEQIRIKEEAEKPSDLARVIDNNNSPVNDENPNSPYSLGNYGITSSTPDGQSKSSYQFQNPPLDSEPSTSAGIFSSGSAHLQPQTHPHTHPNQRQLHQPLRSRFPISNPSLPKNYQNETEAAAYVLPDYDLDEHDGQHRAEVPIIVGKSAETDERGYEVYDPSPNYREHAPYDAADEEEDFDQQATSRSGKFGSSAGGSGRISLLPWNRQRQRVPTIMPMSSSMPDEVTTSTPMSSSLHPSTASAESTTASTAIPTSGKCPPTSLKRAVADTVQNVGKSLMPAPFHRRFFNHKRSGSNTSHKSTSSNPNTTSNSNTNLTSGKNLSTIESGGSGSTGSYTATPRFFTPAKTTISSSENPNYKHQPLNKSLDTTASPTKSPTTTTTPSISENPNYSHLPAPGTDAAPISHPNYIMMVEPQQQPPRTALPTPFTHVSVNPNYQLMGPAPPMTTQSSSTGGFSTQPFTSLSAALRREQSRERFYNSDTSSASSDDEPHTENIKMERMPLNRKRSSERAPTSKRSSRSRSQSRSKFEEQPSSATTMPLVSTASAAPSTNFSLKEKWLRQQQTQQPPPPPPNGFIGRDA